MFEMVKIAIELGSIIALLAVTVYVSKTNSGTIKDKILPELETIRTNLTAINLHLNGVIELKKRSDEDHDKIVVLTEKSTGMQTGLNAVRGEFKEHVKTYHTRKL